MAGGRRRDMLEVATETWDTYATSAGKDSGIVRHPIVLPAIVPFPGSQSITSLRSSFHHQLFTNIQIMPINIVIPMLGYPVL